MLVSVTSAVSSLFSCSADMVNSDNVDMQYAVGMQVGVGGCLC